MYIRKQSIYWNRINLNPSVNKDRKGRKNIGNIKNQYLEDIWLKPLFLFFTLASTPENIPPCQSGL